MPELPEVEIIKLGLQKRITGLKIKRVEILSPKSFQNVNGKPFDFAQSLRGRKVLNIWRKAKILGLELTPVILNEVKNPSRMRVSNKLRDPSATPQDDNVTLLFHLKMTGQLIWIGNSRFIGGHPTPDMLESLPHKHTRVIFTFSDNSKLYFNDQRRFGWIKVIDSGSRQNDKRDVILNLFQDLGPEPLEEGFTWQILKSNLLHHKSQAIKVAILDQKVVAGIGNIYASEACFAAKIDPRKKVGDLGDREFKKLQKGVIRVLKDGIKYGGATKTHFVDSDGCKGYFLDYAFVYGRDKHPCKKCDTEIKKVQLGGRGTYFCPKCQK